MPPTGSTSAPAVINLGADEEDLPIQVEEGRKEITQSYTATPIHWSPSPEQFPLETTIQLPTGSPKPIPKIQYSGDDAGKADISRLSAIKAATEHAWYGYRDAAFGNDEVKPVSGGSNNPFNGWGATLVDSLDTLWMMGMNGAFDEAVDMVRTIDFTTSLRSDIPLFETTIRYLGGLIAAYDISGKQQKYSILLDKAVELAEIMYAAFDTPNRMPQTFYRWKPAYASQPHRASNRVVLAELGSMSLEFTRLAQLTGEPKYFDAIQRITDALDEWQNKTRLPGMWPLTVDAKRAMETFSLGGQSDSTYEYLPKEYLLLGGHADQYKNMYERAANAITESLIFKPMTIDNRDILISGTMKVTVNISSGGFIYNLYPELEHLTCFAGGMFAMAGKIFNRPGDIDIGRKLTDGCVWAYESTTTGIMPEMLTAMECEKREGDCPWNQTAYWRSLDPYMHTRTRKPVLAGEFVQKKIEEERLPPGFTKLNSRKYILRPEAIESVFYMYRITGDPYWREVGWNMFIAIDTHTRALFGNAAIDDVTKTAPELKDTMESFWIAETLKYFYLLFDDANNWSLDDWVLNTEAHFFRRPK
ncbi:MAG: glycoside hydrolase family 47 protein [Acidomyces sp. 'richmondensis']|nr:MAG: glycoside hydrolase family 47 protein [Acidomyces sp. 'richmondensis']